MIVASPKSFWGWRDVQSENPSRRARSDPYPDRLTVLIVARLSDPIIPSLRDGSFPAHNPGNKLPGYVHSVPTGQRLTTP